MHRLCRPVVRLRLFIFLPVLLGAAPPVTVPACSPKLSLTPKDAAWFVSIRVSAPVWPTAPSTMLWHASWFASSQVASLAKHLGFDVKRAVEMWSIVGSSQDEVSASAADKQGVSSSSTNTLPPMPIPAIASESTIAPLVPISSADKEPVKVTMTIANVCSKEALLYTINEKCELVFDRRIPAGEAVEVLTPPGKRWVAVYESSLPPVTFAAGPKPIVVNHTAANADETLLLRQPAQR
jgi:hypothetical protein